MEVAVAAPDFHFDSACTTPRASAPSSPKRHSGKPFDFFRHYTSAPTSPTRASLLYEQFDAVASTRSPPPPPPASSGVPFHWEERPGTAKSCEAKDDGEFASDGAYEFSFDFSGHLDKDGLPEPTAADELFEEGKIRPLKLPPRFHLQASMDDGSSRASSPSSSRGLWSPRHRGRVEAREECDPFAAAMVEATRERGREREKAPPDSLPPLSFSRSRKGSRSLSPLRGVGRFFKSTMTPNSPSSAAMEAPLKNGNGSKKWRLKDLLLFRSASEGRATGNRSKDPLRKYTLLPSLNDRVEYSAKLDLKNSSFRSSTDGSGSMRTASSFSHQMHYSTNRAAAEDLRRKTALPYRQSFFGCLRFNPALLSITKGFARQ